MGWEAKLGIRKSGKRAQPVRRIAVLAIAVAAIAAAPGGVAAGTFIERAVTGYGWHGHSAPYRSAGNLVLPVASVQGDAEPLGSPGAGGRSAPVAPATPRSEATRAAWSDHLQEMLIAAGFDNAVLLSGQDLERLGDRLTAAWVASDGDLFGLLYVFPAKEPGSTMQAFVDQVSANCPGQFVGGVAKLDAIKDRSIGRAEATCREPSKAVHYDMIFYFTPDGTVGISHVGYDADLDRARKINNGLMEIFYGL